MKEALLFEHSGTVTSLASRFHCLLYDGCLTPASCSDISLVLLCVLARPVAAAGDGAEQDENIFAVRAADKQCSATVIGATEE